MFKVGVFYIFLAEDAIKVSKVTTLKLVEHSKKTVKCGFPEKSLKKYIRIFDNIGINVVVIDELTNNRLSYFLSKIEQLDINTITPLEGLKIVQDLKKLL